MRAGSYFVAKELQGKDKILHGSIIQDDRRIRLRSYSVASKISENHRQIRQDLLLLLLLLEFVAVAVAGAGAGAVAAAAAAAAVVVVVVVVGANVNAIL